MFGVGLGEIILIIILMIFLINPKDIPVIFLYIKDIYRKLSEVKSEINSQIIEIDKQLQKKEPKTKTIKEYLEPKD